jgi:hypothetical protein
MTRLGMTIVPEGFSPIEAYHADWCDIDRLDKIPLENGERLQILWPDGSKQYITIEVIKSSFEYGDMGHIYSGPRSKAYYNTKYNGLKITIPLCDKRILVKRVKSKAK